MKEFALCFLAYGDEHINEFNKICNKISSIYPPSNIFVLTDDKYKIHNNLIKIFEKKEDFNFNLKRCIIAEAFKTYDTIVMLDTDIDIDIKLFEYMKSYIKSDGMYVKSMTLRVMHKGKFLNRGKDEYCNKLRKLNNYKYPPLFVPEYCVFFKISDIQIRKEFVERWDYIHNSICEFEPTDRHLNLNGAVEGFIMYSACKDVGLPINNTTPKLFEPIKHYASIEVKKTLI
jgi:hypothetical protein